MKPDLRNAKRPHRGSMARLANIHREQPQSHEAEIGVLGCMFLEPKLLDECVVSLKAGAETFHDLKHQVIYETLAEMHAKKEAIDVITVQQRLKDKQMLEAVGGIAYLAALPDTVPSAANLSFYVNIVREKYILRQLIATCTSITERAYEHTDDAVDGLLDSAEAAMLAINQGRGGETRSTHIRSLVQEAISAIETAVTNPGNLIGLSTGLFDLDRKTCGLEGGELVGIGAAPSLGKTTLVTQILEHISETHPVGLFSFEMRGLAIVFRMLAAKAGVNMRDARKGEIDGEQISRLTRAAAALSQRNIYIIGDCPRNLTAVRARARREWREHGIKAWGVDYVQKMSGEVGKRYDGRHDELSAIINGIKEMAMETNAPVLAICTQTAEGKIKGSGDISYECDHVWKLELDKDDIVKLRIEKQRNGPRGVVRLKFNEKFTRFEDVGMEGPEI